MYANDLLLCMRMNKSGSIDVFLLFWCVGVFGCVFGGKWTIDQLCRGMTRVVDFVMETNLLEVVSATESSTEQSIQRNS